jgi:hypothetical protein
MENTTTITRRFARTLLGALALLGAVAALPAQAQSVFLCIDASGRKELTDSYKPGCKTLDVPGSIAAPARKASGGAPRAATPVTTPTDFPKVNTAEQRARDDDRRAILADELRAEQARMAELRAEYKNGEPDRLGNERNYAKYQERVANLQAAIGRSQRNIDALNRELSNIK